MLLFTAVMKSSLPFKQSSCRDYMMASMRSLTCAVLVHYAIYAIFEACISRKLRLGPSSLVNLLVGVGVIVELVLIVDTSILDGSWNLELEQTMSEGPRIHMFAKNSKKGKKAEEVKPASHQSTTSEPPPVEQEPKEPPKQEHKPPAVKKEPRIVHGPVTPYHGLALGSRVDGFLLHPGDIMITHWSRPGYDPPAADPMANPGGHCTLFVDHGYFERRQKDVGEIEHMMNKCFDDGDMILRFGVFDVYWSWSALNPVECFEFQYQTPPANWFLFSRIQASPLPSPLKTWNRRWMVVGRQQPDPPDTQAIRPRLGDVIVRRAEAVVWWHLSFKLQTGDLLIRAGYERVADSDKTLAAVEMYECTINGFQEFTGRSYVTKYRTDWTFRGRDMQYYGDGMIGQGGSSIHYNGPSRRPLSNRSDLIRHEIM